MKVQRVKTVVGTRWILLDSDYQPIDYVTRYLKYLEASGRAPNTLRLYAYALKHYCEFLESKGLNIDKIQSEGISIVDVLVDFVLSLEYPDMLKKVVSIQDTYPALEPKTINTIIVAVVGFYDFLHISYGYDCLGRLTKEVDSKDYRTLLSELVTIRKATHVTLFKSRSPRKEVEFVTRQQVDGMINACKTSRDRALVSLLFETGMRMGEALGLHLSDLQLEDNRIDVIYRPNNINEASVKNFSEGTVFLPAYVSELLRDYIIHDTLKYKSDYVFILLEGANKGKPMSLDAGKKLFQRISKRCGFYVHAHMLRHGFATERIDDGWSLEEISLYLRHKSLGSTRIYAHFSDTAKREKLRPLILEHARCMPDIDKLK